MKWDGGKREGGKVYLCGVVGEEGMGRGDSEEGDSVMRREGEERNRKKSEIADWKK